MSMNGWNRACPTGVQWMLGVPLAPRTRARRRWRRGSRRRGTGRPAAACRSRSSARGRVRRPWRAPGGPSALPGSNAKRPSTSWAHASCATDGSVSSAQYRPAGSSAASHTSWRRSPGVIAANRSARSGRRHGPVDIGAEDGERSRVRDRDHRDIGPDGVVRLGVRRRSWRPRRSSPAPAVSASTSASIGVPNSLDAPAPKCGSSRLDTSGTEALRPSRWIPSAPPSSTVRQEGVLGQDLELGRDVEVGQQLRLDLRRDGGRIGQVRARHVAVLDRGL